jgi:hypothetical protein
LLELQSQLQALRQRCDASDRDNAAKAAEAAAARTRSVEHESQLNALRRQLENSQLQLQIAQTNESSMKEQLDSEKKLHLVDAQSAEQLKRFAKNMYCVLREGALMLGEVPRLHISSRFHPAFFIRYAGAIFARSLMPADEIRQLPQQRQSKRQQQSMTARRHHWH